MQPGIYPDLDIEKYHSSEGISKTGLCLIDKAPAVYRYASDNREAMKETKSLRIGKALHFAMEGVFEKVYATGPGDDRRAKEWKEFASVNPDRTLLTTSEWDQIEKMKAAVHAFGPARDFLTRPGNFEASYYWTDPETRLLCKCRPDWISADQLTVVDFKTAQDVSHHNFRSAAYSLHYFVSAALTIEGIYQTTGILPQRYIFLCVQPTAPFLTAAYEATADEISLGRDFIRRNLSVLKRCLDNGTWPGLPEEILPLGLPRWVKNGVVVTTELDITEELERGFSNSEWNDDRVHSGVYC